MVRRSQFGGLDLDYEKIYDTSSDFKKFVTAQGMSEAQFKALNRNAQTGLHQAYSRSTTASVRSGVDASGVALPQPGAFGAPAVSYSTADMKYAQLLNCSTESQCSKFGKDDIMMALTRFHGMVEQAKGPLKPGMTKPQLVKLLINANKAKLKARKISQKRVKSAKGRAGTKYSRGAFPSQTTNPAMYDLKTGLLKDVHLTQDHVGLTAYDFAGDKHVVKYNPGTKQAFWEAVRKASGAPVLTNVLQGLHELDKRGLPKINQLNFDEHLGKVYQDLDGQWYQVHCTRKNSKRKEMGAGNCKGKKIHWGKYDPEMEFPMPGFGSGKGASMAQAGKRKFITPLGVYTYDQLMKMNLDDILKMMIILEMMDETNMKKTADRMKELGVGPFDPMAAATGKKGQSKLGYPGRQYGAPQAVGDKKTSTSLTDADRMLQQRKYQMDGLNGCGEAGNPAGRCYDDSFYPGACVPDEAICFDPKFKDDYKNYLKSKLGSKAQGYIDNMDRASQFVETSDIKEIDYLR